jgi:hypothetical protein
MVVDGRHGVLALLNQASSVVVSSMSARLVADDDDTGRRWRAGRNPTPSLATHDRRGIGLFYTRL